MKKHITWLIITLVCGMVLAGCNKEKIFFKQVIVGFLGEQQEGELSTCDEGDDPDLVIEYELIHKELFMGVASPEQPYYAVASYQKDGKTFRYDEPLEWSMDRDDLLLNEPLPRYYEYKVYPLGVKLGKTEIIAAAATQEGKTNVDSATAYVVPEMKDTGSIAPIGVVFDEEEWMKVPGIPGSGARRIHTSSDVDVIFRPEDIYFPYGAIQLPELLTGGHPWFDWVDWEKEVGTEPIAFPYQESRWFLCYDKYNRLVALYTQNSKKKPLYRIVWYRKNMFDEEE